MSFFKNLAYPNVIEQLNYDELLNNIKKLFKSYLNDDEIALLESDNYLALLETLAYRELLLRARINDSVKSMLLPYAKGSDLDNVVSIYGIKRLEGVKPWANIELTLSSQRDGDTIIPAGTIFISENGETASLKETLIIPKGELKAQGVSVFDKFIRQSEIKCEYIQTPFPFILKAKHLTNFSGGAYKEDDERLRERAVLSLERFSTAGSKKAYIYQILSSNAKVIEANVANGGAGIVNIYLKTSDMSEETRASVEAYLSADKVRPLTDKIVVKNASVNEITVNGELELRDMFLQAEVDKQIKQSRSSLSLGEDLNLSYIYSLLHQNGVYRVNLKSPNADLIVMEDSFVRLNFNLTYKKAEL